MASLTDEQLPPTSNGVNGHSEPTSKSPDPVASTPLKVTEPAAIHQEAVVLERTTKNADAFAANESHEARATLDSAPAKPETDVEIENAVIPEPIVEEADTSDKKEEPSTVPETLVDVPAEEASATEVVEEVAPDAQETLAVVEVEEKVEEEVAAVEDQSRPEEDELASATKETSEPAEAAPEPSPELKSEPEPAPVPAEEPAEAEDAPAAVAPSKDVDVEMADAVPETKVTASIGVALPEKPATPAARPSHSQSSTSNLLPSLRDDRSREPSAAHDTIMADAPSSKVAREREDDEEEGPLAKRTKTDDVDATENSQAEGTISVSGDTQVDLAPVAMPPRVRAVAKEGSLADPKLDDSEISAYANRELRRVLASVKKTKAGINFKDSVEKKWPALWDSYKQRVAKPMDISLMERNLRESKYATHAEFVSDLFLIYENSITFNGYGNLVTDEAKLLVDNFFTRLSEISAQEPQKSEKKEPKQQPTRHTEPRAAASRRESRGAASSPIEDSVTAISASPIAVSIPPTAGGGGGGGGSVTSPGASAAAAPVEATTPVFAVPSSGVPIIRRDSAKNDGDRPKRPIHPPKNRDLGYEPKNPKKKQPEFRFCEEVLKELMKAKHYEINHWFLRPVDPVAMQIPTYHKVIKKPMDLGTMQTKLNLGEYGSAKDFENDFHLIVKNCRKFNVVGEVVQAADKLEELFKEKWTEKDSWIAAHTAQAQSVVSPTAAKDDESDAEAEESDEEEDEISVAPLSSDTVDALIKRLAEENDRLNKLLMAKIPDMTMISTQQVVLNMIQKQIVEEKTKLAAAEEKRPKKPAKAKPAKAKKPAAGAAAAKKGSTGGAAAGGAKKASGAAVKKAPKARVLGQAEKNVVTDGINNLDGAQLEKAIDIIKKDTSQEESETGELELDIDQLSQDALGKLYDLIVKAFPNMKVKQEKTKASSSGDASGASKPGKPKKHKPMGKLEQERNIEKLREIKAQFQRPGSGSQEPLPSVEVNQGAEEEEEESEEESEVDSEED